MKLKNIFFLIVSLILIVIYECSSPTGTGTANYTSASIDDNPRIVQIPVDTTNGLYRQIFYYPSGLIKAEGYIQYEEVTGLWVNYHKNGSKRSEGYAQEGRIQGLWTYYYPDGTIQKQGNWQDGHKTGTWYYWDENGQLIETRQY